ncbi:hypothetical protein V498_10730 [Pseudogymnoascus sp. VKM F-4517 (FW-2822)]|nr:hypothetical protein V498_10730 [Pseudogymnoascus sp. VKM F-4517 (FW-2822)]
MYKSSIGQTTALARAPANGFAAMLTLVFDNNIWCKSVPRKGLARKPKEIPVRTPVTNTDGHGGRFVEAVQWSATHTVRLDRQELNRRSAGLLSQWYAKTASTRQISSQKPGDELYAQFKANFGNVIGESTAGALSCESGLDNVIESQTQGYEELKHVIDLTPRAQQHDGWRLTPSLGHLDSFSFTALSNRLSGYYAATPGGGVTLHHSQAGDLHTPRIGMGREVEASLVMQADDGGVHGGLMKGFSPYLHNLPQQNCQRYGLASSPGGTLQQPQQESYALSTFLHQDTDYETMDGDWSSMNNNDLIASLDGNMQHQPPPTLYQTRQIETSLAPLPSSGENRRFHVVLHAPTAMIQDVEEIPITYLNKGQAYSVSVVDTSPIFPIPINIRYRTFVRIFFEDEQQRQKPETYWQLWKDGRGINEAHQRGGKLQAVDGPTECNIAVRFNFLSTDFSHSKGVQGIPVRFCVKTEVLNASLTQAVPNPNEIAYCKVKLFRDHGAERKHSNDTQHVRKTIVKLKEQIKQSEAGMKDSKRKRIGSVSKPVSQRAGKVQKHKRTWSVSSASSAGSEHLPLLQDLHLKLQQQQDMFTSTSSVSVLYLRGSEQDDPAIHLVSFPTEPSHLAKVASRKSGIWQQRTSARSSTADISSLKSPLSSSVSLHSQLMTGTSILASAGQCSEYQNYLGADMRVSTSQQLASPPDQVNKVLKPGDAGSLSSWIEVLGMDAGYRAPAERPMKPAACFYLVCPDPANPDKKQYYRAVYLAQRTLKDLVGGIAAKWNIELPRILRAIRVLPEGVEVEMDDDIVREMKEGQDVGMEVSRVAVPESPVKGEREIVLDGKKESINSATQDDARLDDYEIRLIF